MPLPSISTTCMSKAFICTGLFVVLSVAAPHDRAHANPLPEERASAQASAARAACTDLQRQPLTQRVITALGAPLRCEAQQAMSTDEAGDDAPAPYPFDDTVILDWETATIALDTNYPEPGVYQQIMILEADEGSPLDRAWFTAVRGALFAHITDWSTFDAATQSGTEQIIELEAPDGATDRGPIIGLYPDGSISVIDQVSGTF